MPLKQPLPEKAITLIDSRCVVENITNDDCGMVVEQSCRGVEDAGQTLHLY